MGHTIFTSSEVGEYYPLQKDNPTSPCNCSHTETLHECGTVRVGIYI